MFPPPAQADPGGGRVHTPTSALARAINIASKKLFGSPIPRSPTARRLPIIPAVEDNVGLNPEEDDLLAYLEDMAQKSQVLVEWSDQKYTKLEAISSSMFVPFFVSKRPMLISYRSQNPSLIRCILHVVRVNGQRKRITVDVESWKQSIMRSTVLRCTSLQWVSHRKLSPPPTSICKNEARKERTLLTQAPVLMMVCVVNLIWSR
jgi:hypothetical protein